MAGGARSGLESCQQGSDMADESQGGPPKVEDRQRIRNEQLVGLVWFAHKRAHGQRR